ncbi:phosphoribosyltransferase [Euzebya tangerina]|uniref:phosphoribosyltransferase n=1 Tax=Euzebya tangerina TaxID=591198 RepID=UPI0013C3086A|nr:phosphoribosyltransferase [Euzebya tangerina]
MSMRLAALVRLFFNHHADCVGDFDRVVAVRSTRRAAPASLLQTLPEFRDFDLDALRATEEGFVADSRLAGNRVLLIDDTFTRGTSMFTAAAAIKRAGSEVFGRVAIGRRVNPSFENSKPMCERLSSVPFDMSRCCRCDGVVTEPPLRDSMF